MMYSITTTGLVITGRMEITIGHTAEITRGPTMGITIGRTAGTMVDFKAELQLADTPPPLRSEGRLAKATIYRTGMYLAGTLLPFAAPAAILRSEAPRLALHREAVQV